MRDSTPSFSRDQEYFYPRKSTSIEASIYGWSKWELCTYMCKGGVCEKVANTVYGAAVRSIANYTGCTLVACAAAYREIEPRWRKDPQTTIKI